MDYEMYAPVPDRHADGRSRFALRFMLVSVLVFAAAGFLAYGLIRLDPEVELRHDALWHPDSSNPSFGGQAGVRRDRLVEPAEAVAFPVAFWLSTGLLAAGSVLLHRAVQQVRLERQKPFRQSLLWSLAAGGFFVGVQSYGLWCLITSQDPSQATHSAGAVVFVFAALHGLHFTLAVLFLVFVVLQAFADRYDHEYYWGVTVCGYFWHALGAVWGVILGALGIAVAV